jgi:hypothetical protein
MRNDPKLISQSMNKGGRPMPDLTGLDEALAGVVLGGRGLAEVQT